MRGAVPGAEERWEDGSLNPLLLCLLGLFPSLGLQIGVTEPLVHTERLFGGFFSFVYLAQWDGKGVWFGSCPQGRLQGGKGNHVLEKKSDGIEIRRRVAVWEGAGCSRVLPRPAEAGSGARCGGVAVWRSGLAGAGLTCLPCLGGDERLREGLVLV